MDVILLQRVEKLGQMGDVVKVREGYGRNYLLPKGVAVRATAEKLKEFEARRKQLEAENLQLRSEAEKVAEKMAGLAVVVISSAGETGHLYGSVRPKDVADKVCDAGFTVNRSQIVIASPIKTLGLHKVAVQLHPEVKVDVTVNVALSEEEAIAQAAGEKKAAAEA